jgi:hypothetical protein
MVVTTKRTQTMDKVADVAIPTKLHSLWRHRSALAVLAITRVNNADADGSCALVSV